ncbi:MAG: tetratricopeptide repeat protein [Myxococcales bacterium]
MATGADATGVDELLDKGGELLNAGNLAEARELLEKAYKLAPKDSKAQNLLGLTYFKMGIFDSASEVYEALVRDNPVDPTLRVNLGLVYLKLSALARATREFETAVDLAPDHKKAQNYLGLAYAQAGEYARAKDCFVAAGSLTMAEKMERALKDPAKAPRGAATAQAAEAGQAKVASEAITERPASSLLAAAKEPDEARQDVEIEVEVDSGAASSAAAVAAATPETTSSAWDSGSEAAGEVLSSQPVEVEEEAVEAPPDEMPAPPLNALPEPPPAPRVRMVEPAPPAPSAPAVSEMLTGVLPLSELTRSVAATATTREPFEVQRDLLFIKVQGEILTRLEGLLAVSGALQYLPEMKRFRGKATDKAFGDGDRRMVRLAGSATVTLAARGRVFLPIDLADESAYFLEETVFAFEESVVFENGRVPSRIAPDLHLVHLRGKGRVLLALPTPVRSVAITPGVGCATPMAVLVGWHGSLTPKIVGLPEERDGVATTPSVELTGEGYALVSALKPAVP